jgi:hypothetical protein
MIFLPDCPAFWSHRPVDEIGGIYATIPSLLLISVNAGAGSVTLL